MAAPDPLEMQTLVSVPAGAIEGSLDKGSLGTIEPNEATWKNFVCRATHPVAAFCHIAFFGGALTLYIFGSFFGLDYVTVFITSVLLLALDFWTVKNISGRKLVGLRWWVAIKEDGGNQYIFESAAPNTRKISAIDKRIFWWRLYLAPAVWGFFALLSFLSLSFDWFLIDAVGVALTSSNLVGYLKCSSDASKKLTATLTSGAIAGLGLVPGALPALGATMMTVLRSQASGLASRVSGGASAASAGASAPQAPAASQQEYNPFTQQPYSDTQAVTI